MCGIAGIVNFKFTDKDSLQNIRRMVGAVLHRGPDEQGVYIDDQVALGHARLSIVDLASGTQPIHNEDESIWIVYNGEVFNFLELKAELESLGHRFYTKTDTEVIVHLYEEYGVSCFERLIGQFALALWNLPLKQMILARDRVGIRPLFYSQQQSGFYFASEIKALAASDMVPLSINPCVLSQIFTFWSPLPGKSIFDHIHEVPPGSYAIIADQSIQIKSYWQWPCPSPDNVYEGTYDELVEELGSTLENAINIRMRADVPVASYVSGGLDSSGVSAIARTRFNPDLHTFGIRFDDPAYDEGIYQNAMVSWLDTDHTALTATSADIGQAFTRCIWHLEQPVLRTAPAPLFLLSKNVHEAGYKVVLTGEGADEVFGGYNIFKETKVRRFWSRQPNSKYRPLLLKRLYPYIFKDSRLAGITQAFFGQGLERIDEPFFSHMLRWGESDQRLSFLSNDLRKNLSSYKPEDKLIALLPDGFAYTDWLNKAQTLESSLFMSQYLLSAQGDRPAMAHSVEIRLPYLDHRLIELASRIPAHWKICGMNEKKILKDTLARWLPPMITNRAKHPYRAPVKDPLLNNENVREAISTRSIESAGLFDAVKVGHLLRKISSVDQSSERDRMTLVAVASTQILSKCFIGQKLDVTLDYELDLLIDHRTSSHSLLR